LKEAFRDKKGVLWIDFLREGEALTFLQRPSELRARLDALPEPPTIVVLDEVQRVPGILNEVHALIEERGTRFALTGSSARKLKRGGANLLAGRAFLNHLYPLTFLELGDDFSLERVLNWGSLPGLTPLVDDASKASFLRTYVDVYLREEIREEQIVRNLDPFARFLDVAAQCNGTIINYSRIARDAGTDSKEFARYFQIFEETLVGFFLEPYHASIRKRQRQQAKFYFFDVGVKRALEGSLRVPVAARTYEFGRAFEHLVLLEVHRLNAYRKGDYKFSYLRTHNDAEIDLIAERRGDQTWAIEIKSSEEIDPIDVQKLAALAADIPKCKAAIFCNTTVARTVNGVQILPWKEGVGRLFD
jgi:predicted AAA+ superfamily ATPase